LINLREINNKIIKKENFYFLIIVIFIFCLDRFTKIEIINNFSDNTHYINDYINFDLIWNVGIGFGLLSTNSIVFYNLVTIFIGVIIIFLLYVFIFSKKIDKIIYSTIIGGALGNFYDRLFYNAVPDFVDLHYANFHWFTFNVADIFISFGVIFFIIRSFYIKDDK
tara:strand:- start:163 stop:660 length:498 start_codon:yes stop_codon:yes gene_type:complete